MVELSVAMKKALSTLERARDLVAAELKRDLDPIELLRQNQELQNFFQGLPPEEAECRASPEFEGVPFGRILTTIGLMLADSVATDRARRPKEEEPTPPGVTAKVLEAVALRRRVGDIVAAYGSAPSVIQSIRKVIFGDRAPSPSRASMEAELDLMIVGFEKLEEKPPPLIAYWPKVKAMRRELHCIQPLPFARKPSEPLWSPATTQNAWLVHTAHGMALAWVLAVANSEKTVSTAQRIVLNRRQSDRSASSSDEAPPPSSEDKQQQETER